MALPNYIEDHVINIKNILLENGLKEGVNEISKKAKDIISVLIGKNKNKSTNVDEIRALTKQNGVINSFSKMVSKAIDKSVENNMISKNIGSVLKSGKTAMLSTFSEKLENKLYNEIKSLEGFKREVNNWNKSFSKNDIKGMKQSFKKLEKHYNEISVEIRELIDFEKISYTQEYIEKNNIKNISEDEKRLLEKIA